MPLVYITGPTAAGKSTVRGELARRGFEAHDADEDGISAFFGRVSGERAEYPEDANDRTQEWLAMHEFLMSRQRVEELRAQANDKPVFLCGIPVNALGMADLFDKIICLVIDEATMLDRVAARTTNPFGKAPAERELIVRSREPTIEAYRRSGALMIDGAQPIAGVLDEVLAVAARQTDVVAIPERGASSGPALSSAMSPWRSPSMRFVFGRLMLRRTILFALPLLVVAAIVWALLGVWAWVLVMVVGATAMTTRGLVIRRRARA